MFRTPVLKFVPVIQWIEWRPPESQMQVRLLPGAHIHLTGFFKSLNFLIEGVRALCSKGQIVFDTGDLRQLPDMSVSDLNKSRMCQELFSPSTKPR